MIKSHNDVKSPRRELISQFLLFAGVGAIGTAGHYAVLLFLVQVAEYSPVVATTYGFIVGALINYYLNYYYTFGSEKRHSEAMVKFMIVAGFGCGLNAAIMLIGTSWMSLNYILVQLAATGTVLLSNFVLNRWWTFAGGKK